MDLKLKERSAASVLIFDGFLLTLQNIRKSYLEKLRLKNTTFETKREHFDLKNNNLNIIERHKKVFTTFITDSK